MGHFSLDVRLLFEYHDIVFRTIGEGGAVMGKVFIETSVTIVSVRIGFEQGKYGREMQAMTVDKIRTKSSEDRRRLRDKILYERKVAFNALAKY